jgi:hypothetical protein
MSRLPMFRVPLTARVCFPSPKEVPIPAAYAASITKGVAFTRADGRTGLARAKDGGIDIDYAVNSTTAWRDRRTTKAGIFEERWLSTPTDDYIVGGGPGGVYEYNRSGKEPSPTPGTTWATTLRQTLYTYDGTENGERSARARFKVSYSFLAAQEVTLSGCKYTAIPVELRGPNTKLIRRWMYFPDLGFGLETRMTDPETGKDRKLGLKAMTAAN